MSKDTILRRNGEEIEEVSLNKFLADFQKEHEVQGIDHQDGDVDYSMPADEVVASLYQLANEGETELPEQVAAYTKPFKAMIAAIKTSKELVEERKKAAEAAKDAEKAAKEAAKKEKEEEEKKTLQRRNLFLDSASKGMQQAASEFADDLRSMKDSLPTGIAVKLNDDNSFGLAISENATEEDISRTLGLLLGMQSNSAFLANAYQFMIGELANELVGRGVYKSMIQCGKELSEKVAKDGIKLSPRNIESYSRMARRIPIELRNPKADPTAYLALSDIPYPDKPKKTEGMSEMDYAAALVEHKKACDLIDEDRLKLAKQLKDGKVVTSDKEGNKIETPFLSRKDVLPAVKELKLQHSLIEEEDPNKRTTSDWMRQLAEATLLKEHFMGVHKKGAVFAIPGAESSAAPREISAKELEELIEEAKNNLTNILFGDKDEFAALQAGVKVVKVQVFEDKDGKKVAKKDAGGNLEYKDEEKKVYPRFISYRE